jgi:hypothetical protein
MPDVTQSAQAERVTYEPGIYPDMPLAHYYADPAPTISLNSTNIPVIVERSPLHFAHRSPVLVNQLGLEPAVDMPSAAMRQGSVTHRLALGKGSDYVVLDFKDFRTNEAKDARKAAEAVGTCAILRHEYNDAAAQAPMVKDHLDELFMGEPYQTEVAVLWTEEVHGQIVYCRTLIDAWCPTLRHGVELKSTTNASEVHAKKRMQDGGYDTQNMWERRGLARANKWWTGDVGFSTLFVETKPPYGTQAFNLSDAWADSAWSECEKAMAIFARCVAANKWPGYQRQSKGLLPPAWLINRRLEVDLGEDDVEGIGTASDV